ncbi:MAG: UDP-4-amino-4-deoxy-L-arabinose--oxoglutarate aminotransferase (EC [uncultured Sulfurovum sp.]|uniref:UDP-4-amino-4-deoxy-L-arabinose--oxoglutarate aminotransferase (EC) n=1 Tax=uncultured Sulfurovum sp. TaxID=269237 RepID=A0A6S6T9J4_9BACT|nr:MAG: UDP-4-amino-4-deoxy-L-arabinose--oxoglutarate aminotransferase (EC [uncultured Sulfurovum sp.]
MQNTIEFYKPSIQENTKKYIDDVLNFSDNRKVEKLENAVKKFIGCDNALAVTSGTAALHLAMCALDFKRGDKVICSINVFPSVPQAVRHFDAEPIFVDIEGKDYNIDLGNLELALQKNKSKKLKAIVLNHMAGNIVDLEAVYALASEYKVKVIEDASNALGAKYNGKYIGNTGADITIFSFAPHLCNSTVNGGILICKEESVHTRAQLLSFHGMKNRHCDIYGSVNYIYDVVDIGWKYDLSQIEAAYCLAEFEALEATLRRRKEIAKMYTQELSGINHVSLPQLGNDTVISQYIVEIDKNRDHFVGQLKNEGINISVHYMPLHLTAYYKQKYSMKVFDYSVALGCFQRVMSLPMYASLTNEEVKRVCEAIKKVANAHI